mgnify:CR=1 FL=1
MDESRELIGASRALNYEEPLLWDYAQNEAGGVDLPKPRGTKLRTHIAARESIGWPQLKEPQVLRHFVRLSTQNFSIDHGFFPLGSCTMKHNPRVNELAAALPGFTQAHPYQSETLCQGTLELLWELEQMLCELTGMSAFSLHPAAGAQCELTGLLVTRAHFQAKK